MGIERKDREAGTGFREERSVGGGWFNFGKIRAPTQQDHQERMRSHVSRCCLIEVKETGPGHRMLPVGKSAGWVGGIGEEER